MAVLKPTFSLSINSFSSDTENPAGGVKSFIVDRDMDIPADSLRIELTQRSGIALGDEVSLDLGHDAEEETVFTGNVIALLPTCIGIEVRALGKMNELLNLRTSAVFENQTAGSIAWDLIGQAGLSAGTIDEGPALPRYTLDMHLCVFRHLKGLADCLGYELYADCMGNIMFHALGKAADLDAAGGLTPGAGSAASLPGPGAAERYIFGQHLLSASSRRQYKAWGTIKAGGESPMSEKGDSTAHWFTVNDANYGGTAGSGAPALLILEPLARTKDLADRFAAGRLAVASRRAHEVTVKVLGRPGIDLGDSIASGDLPDELQNAGGYVRAIRHRFGEDTGFVSDFRICVDLDE